MAYRYFIILFWSEVVHCCFCLRMFFMVVADPSLQLLVLAGDKLLGGEVGVVGVVLHHIVAALS